MQKAYSLLAEIDVSGLRPSIRMQVVGFWYTNFSYLISQALELKRVKLEVIAEKGVRKKEKNVKITIQSTSSGLGKRKNFRGSSTHRFGRGRSSV